jgi:hypothetical protein
MSTGSSEPPGLDELRRRLYGPDASAEDVARYEAAAGDAAGTEAEGVSESPARRVPQGRWIAVSGGVLAVVGALAVGVVAGRPSAAPTPSAAPASGVIVAQLPAPAPARTTFEEALVAGGNSGLLDYVYRHPELLPPAILTVGRADSTEYSGEGTTTLSLSPSALAERGGRVTVILVLARSGKYEWRSIRVAGTSAGFASGSAVTSAGGEAQAGAPVAGTFSYGRGAPSRLTVVVADGTRWGAVVDFTD